MTMKNCADCGRAVASGRYYREVTGWERPREQGGANQITLRQETGRVKCFVCVEYAKLHGQQPLL